MIRDPHLGPRLLVVATGGGAVLAAVLPSPPGVVQAAAAAALTACAAAAATGWRLLGTAAVAAVTSTALLAEALDDSARRPVHLVGTAALLLALVAALDRAEDTGARPAPVTVRHRGLGARLGPSAAALAGVAVVAATAGVETVASVPLVLAGVLAAVAALVLATRAHRNRPMYPDVEESLSDRSPAGDAS